MKFDPDKVERMYGVDVLRADGSWLKGEPDVVDVVRASDYNRLLSLYRETVANRDSDMETLERG